MKKKTDVNHQKSSINPIDVFSTVPAAAHFIETNMRPGLKTIGAWLKTIDDDSLSYILDLFKPMKEAKPPEGMSLPVCDIVSLCLLAMEWEGGKKFGPEKAWDDALPLIPRLRRAVMFESLRRKGVINVVRFSILDDSFDVRVSNGELTDSMFASFMGIGLVGNDDVIQGLDDKKTPCGTNDFEFFDDQEKWPPEDPSDWH